MPDSNSTPVVKPCVKCGATDRYASGDCRPCHLTKAAARRKQFPEKVALEQARYRAENLEELKIKSAVRRAGNVDIKRRSDAAYQLANAERIKITKKEYYEKNRESIKAKSAGWRKNNPEKMKAANDRSYKLNHLKIKSSSSEWRIANPVKVRRFASNYRMKHPELRIVWEQNRRARKRESGGKLSVDISEKLFALQKGKCACCKRPLGDDYHIDHIMPLALGGANSDDNVQLLRKGCNLSKSSKHPVDFMQSRGFLL